LTRIKAPASCRAILRVSAHQTDGRNEADDEIKRDVEDALRSNTEIDDSDIAVKVENAVVTLTGFVHEYSQTWLAEDAVKRVPGVLGIANDIESAIPRHGPETGS
jgi:osmotically-inducible protein OsmY